MGNQETILAVISTLKSLFADKHELRGFDDWDAFLGCVMALEGVSENLAQEKAEAEENTTER